MKIKITYFVLGMEFEAVTHSIPECYEYVKAIVKTNKISFPNPDETLLEYMGILMEMKNNNRLISHKNHIFMIERIIEQDIK